MKRFLLVISLLMVLCSSCSYRGDWLDVVDERRDRLQEAWKVLIDAKGSLCGIMSCEYNRGLPYSDGYTYNNGAYEITFTNGKKVTFDVIKPDDLHKYKDRDGSPICCITWIQEETFPGTNATRFHFTIDHDRSRDIIPMFYDCYFEKVGGSNYGTGAIPPKYQIWYTTSDEKVIDIYYSWYVEHGINPITNIYYGDNLYLNHKKGIIAFDQDIEILSEGLFLSNNSVTSIILPDNIETIMGQAFASCSNLSAIYCPCLLPPSMHEEALWGVADNIQLYVPVASVEFYKTAAGWSAYADAIVGYDFEKGVDIPNTPAVPYSEIRYTTTDGSTLPFVANSGLNTFGAKIVSNTYENGVGILTFDAPVSKIGTNAFLENHLLKSIELPQSTTQFGSHAFCYCINLESVNIPSGVTQIGACAFGECRKLNDITLPEGLSVIEAQTFAGCQSLTNITIPASVVEIEEQVFYSCNAMREVYCKPSTPPSTTKRFLDTWESFSGCFDATIYVPMESVEAYKTAEDWSEYADSIVGYDF